jgi:hypothetical protein
VLAQSSSSPSVNIQRIITGTDSKFQNSGIDIVKKGNDSFAVIPLFWFFVFRSYRIHFTDNETINGY